MDPVVKAFLSKTDGSTEVRRLHFALSNPNEISGKFRQLQAQLATIFPDLRGKPFIMSWRDSDGDYVLMSSDDELLEALSEMENKQLKVYITESPAELGDDATAALFPAQAKRGKARGPWMRVSEEEAGDRSVQDDKGWKTSLRDLVPTMHRRWAKEHIRQWRQKHLSNGTATGSSDGERPQKVTAEEADVPPTYVKYLDIQVFRLHKVWAQEKPGKIEPEFEAVKASVPQAFQNWCRWYLKKMFGPNRTPRFRPAKSKIEPKNKDFRDKESKDKSKDQDTRLTEGEKEANAWKKEWKVMRKQIRDAVPAKDREWTKTFIKQWRLDNLTEAERGRYMTETAANSSDSEDDSKDEKSDPKAGPEFYSKWLSLYLTQWHSNQGDTLSNLNAKVAQEELRQITDVQVPPSYRKWVKFYISRVLTKVKKDRQKEAEVLARRQYYRWMVLFQERWIAKQDDTTSNSSGDDVDTPKKKVKSRKESAERPRVVIERLQGIIDSDGEYDDEMPVPPFRKPPSEFRHWALEIFRTWDGTTMGHGLPAEVKPSSSEEDVEQEIPPGVLNWMRKALARILIKRLRTEVREAGKNKKESRDKGDDAKEGLDKGNKSRTHPHQE